MRRRTSGPAAYAAIHDCAVGWLAAGELVMAIWDVSDDDPTARRGFVVARGRITWLGHDADPRSPDGVTALWTCDQILDFGNCGDPMWPCLECFGARLVEQCPEP